MTEALFSLLGAVSGWLNLRGQNWMGLGPARTGSSWGGRGQPKVSSVARPSPIDTRCMKLQGFR